MTGKRLALVIARERGIDAPAGLARFEAHGLAIVHAPAPIDAATPSTQQVQAFASAVDRLHREETVLPLRYGWIVESESGLRAVIDLHRETWIKALDAVEGCDEMGLRVLLDTPSTDIFASSRPPSADSATDRPGTAYLAALRHRMAGSEALSREAERASATIGEALSGLFRGSVTELPGPGRERLLSLVFLVHRSHLDAFRTSAKALEGRIPGQILLTGPWPPYNFAGPTAATGDLA